MKTKSFSLDFIIYSIIVIFTIIFTTSFDYSNKNMFVIITFYVIGFISFFSIVFSKQVISIFRTAHIFNYIFFFMAPLQQYLTNGGLSLWKVTGVWLYYTDSIYIKANLVIIIGTICFNTTYLVYKKNKPKQLDDIRLSKNVFVLDSKLKITLMLISSLSIVYIILTNNLNSSGELIGDAKIGSQISNIVKYFPVCSILIFLTAYKDNLALLKKDLYFSVIIVEFLFVFFPFGGKMARFILLGTYVVLISALFNNTKYKSFYFFIFFVGFSLNFSSLKYASDISALFSFKMNFIHGDYDAYQLLMTIIDYSDNYATANGLNIFSALMFLLPRSVWSGKMEATGGIVLSNYGSWFTNVSAPYIGEWYFAFGKIGVVIGTVVTALIIKRIDMWSKCSDSIKKGCFCILCGMTIYIARGSLLSTLSYTLGLVLSLLFVNLLVKVISKIHYI